MYRVKRYFEDLQDNNKAYNAGDEFPRKGFEVSQERIDQLSSPNNLQGEALIEYVDDPVEPVQDEKPVEESKSEAYTEETLMGMTNKEIKALAEKCGYKITATNKAGAVAEFLKQQNA